MALRGSLLAALAAALMAPSLALAQSAPAADPPQGGGFHQTMDKVFGPGGWRQTSGYRTQAEEDELRREGAGTVPIGEISHHSMGTRDAPGAYDVVVPGMSTEGAAEKLRGAEVGFSRIFAERAHGSQGSHLHIEPGAASASGSAVSVPAAPEETIYLRVVNGRRNPKLVHH